MLSRVIEIAAHAGAAIIRNYGTSSKTLKEDQSPLTLADTESHAVIIEGLKTLAPNIPIISEEGIIPAYEERKHWPVFWLVDPLDGTKEFLNCNGEFTVNIALIQDLRPTLGVIYAPALKQFYYAKEGEGAWKQSEGGPAIRIFSSEPKPGVDLRVVESRSHPSDEMESYLAQFPVKERIFLGSSLKFCLLAEGKADIYPRLVPTMEWDVAAGDCIFRNSAVSGMRKSSLTYNKPSLKNDRFLLGV